MKEQRAVVEEADEKEEEKVMMKKRWCNYNCKNLEYLVIYSLKELFVAFKLKVITDTSPFLSARPLVGYRGLNDGDKESAK